MAIKTICFFNSAKVWGGGEKWHFEMATQMHKSGFDVIFVTNSDSILLQKLINSGIKVFHLKVKNLSFVNPLKIKYVAEVFKQNYVSHLIINLSADLKIAGIAAELAGVQHIIYRRGSAIPIKNSLSNRLIFKKIVTNIIANTQATKLTVNQNFTLFDERKIKVIYNGICLDEYDKILLEPKEKTDKFVIGNIGRLVEQKAQYLLLDLAEYLQQKGVDFKIVIGGSGKLQENLENLCKQKKLCNIVEFVGFVDNPKQFLHNIDVFVLTSLWEGFGYVLVEAMASQVPTIAFDISSNPEIIDDNKTGFLVDFKNIYQLAEKIMYHYHNKDVLLQLGKNARKKVEEKFTFKKSYSDLVDFLNAM